MSNKNGEIGNNSDNEIVMGVEMTSEELSVVKGYINSAKPDSSEVLGLLNNRNLTNPNIRDLLATMLVNGSSEAVTHGILPNNDLSIFRLSNSGHGVVKQESILAIRKKFNTYPFAIPDVAHSLGQKMEKIYSDRQLLEFLDNTYFTTFLAMLPLVDDLKNQELTKSLFDNSIIGRYYANPQEMSGIIGLSERVHVYSRHLITDPEVSIRLRSQTLSLWMDEIDERLIAVDTNSERIDVIVKSGILHLVNSFGIYERYDGYRCELTEDVIRYLYGRVESGMAFVEKENVLGIARNIVDGTLLFKFVYANLIRQTPTVTYIPKGPLEAETVMILKSISESMIKDPYPEQLCTPEVFAELGDIIKTLDLMLEKYDQRDKDGMSLQSEADISRGRLFGL